MKSPTADESLRTLTVRDASRMLGISPAHGYRLARDGQFPGAFRLGDAVRVNYAALMAWQARLVAQAEGNGSDASVAAAELARLPVRAARRQDFAS